MKPRISIHLFGKFSIRCDDRELLTHASTSAREILGYLAVNRHRPVPRETLASLISSDASTERSRKALRQGLWNLRAQLAGVDEADAKHILHSAEGWVELRTDNVWLDVQEFEGTAVSRTLGGGSSVDTRRLVQAIELYRGDLLQGWYRDWCLEERDRLRQIYLETLDALVSACEADREWNAGVAYAGRALHADPARECTHRSLMRIYCAQGDRASALRQYDRCVEALKTELGVGPDAETKDLARAIRAGTRPGCGPLEELPRAELRSRRKP